MKMTDFLEIYIHIPFCVKKCNYCDFLSAPADRETQRSYMEALLKEIARRAVEARGKKVVSIFIGGGTPSIVEPKLLASVVEQVKGYYAVAEDAEITMELNPGTADEEALVCYLKAGINRLSIGLQSAVDTELKTLGRIHTFEQFLKVYEMARKVGFVNVNVDLMSALPGQSLNSYRHTLKTVISLTPLPEHISAYSLIVEEGTVFGALAEKGALQLPTEDTERQMYEETEEILLKKGYHRYEISNYAKEGYACRHNCGYWTRVPYLGFGIGAASLMEETRFVNDSNLQEYLKAPLQARKDIQKLSIQEQMEEFMFLGLRMTCGVSEQAFAEKFGKSVQDIYGSVIAQNEKDGLLVRADGRICLTHRGLDLSNYVMAQFLF